MEFPQRFKTRFFYDPEFSEYDPESSILGIYLKIQICKDICTPVFRAALFK